MCVCIQQGVVSDRAVVAISLYRNETDDDFQSDTNSFVDFVQSNASFRHPFLVIHSDMFLV